MSNIRSNLSYGFSVYNGTKFDFDSFPSWLTNSRLNEDYSVEDLFKKLIIEMAGIDLGKFARGDWQGIQKAISGAFGVTLISSGFDMGEEMEWFLVATDSVKIADCYETTILGSSLPDSGNSREIIKDFCEKASIPFEEPQWFLSVLYQE